MVPTITMGDRLAHLGVLVVWLRVTPEVDEQQLPVFRSPLKQNYPFFAHSGPRSEALYNEFVFLVAVVGSSKGYGDRH